MKRENKMTEKELKKFKNKYSHILRIIESINTILNTYEKKNRDIPFVETITNTDTHMYIRMVETFLKKYPQTEDILIKLKDIKKRIEGYKKPITTQKSKVNDVSLNIVKDNTKYSLNLDIPIKLKFKGNDFKKFNDAKSKINCSVNYLTDKIEEFILEFLKEVK